MPWPNFPASWTGSQRSHCGDKPAFGDPDFGGRQQATFITVQEMKGPAALTGRFVMAEQAQVAHPGVWKTTGAKIKMAIQCLPDKEMVQYPAEVQLAAKSQINPKDRRTRQASLDQALPKVVQTLMEGNDVLVHCQHSVHRAPVTVAAVFKQICGCKASAPVE